MTETQLNNEAILLRQMVETIVREAAPEAIILFGSRARGDARPDSDVDLLVVERGPFSPQRSRRKEAVRLYMVLRELWQAQGLLAKWFHFQPPEIAVLDWQDFNRWREEAVRQIKQRNDNNSPGGVG